MGWHLLWSSLLGKPCNKATARFYQCAGDVAELSTAASVDVALANSSSLSLHPKQTRLGQILAILVEASATRKGGLPITDARRSADIPRFASELVARGCGVPVHRPIQEMSTISTHATEDRCVTHSLPLHVKPDATEISVF